MQASSSKLLLLLLVLSLTGFTLLAWLLGGFLTICAGLTVAELATAIPETGGAVNILKLRMENCPAFY